jgi:hypothetical protein
MKSLFLTAGLPSRPFIYLRVSLREHGNREGGRSGSSRLWIIGTADGFAPAVTGNSAKFWQSYSTYPSRLLR